MAGYTVKRRDVLVQKVCNAMLNHLASKDYRDYVSAVYILGRDRFNAEFNDLVLESLDDGSA